MPTLIPDSTAPRPGTGAKESSPCNSGKCTAISMESGGSVAGYYQKEVYKYLTKSIRKSKFSIEQYIPKRMIGVFSIMHNKDEVLQFNATIIGHGSKKGYMNDQDHPNTIYSLCGDNPNLSEDLCLSMGCDVLVNISKNDSGPIYKIWDRKGNKIILYFETIDLDTACRKALDLSEDITRPRSLIDPMTSLDKEKVFRANLTLLREHQADKPLAINNAKFIIGGAGPEASLSMFGKILQSKEMDGPVIHFSYSQTPSKLDSLHSEKKEALPEGHFVQYYRFAVDSIKHILNNATIITPCNTAHASIEQWFDHSNSSLTIKDFRVSLIDYLQKNGVSLIGILGTSATTHDNQIYQEYAKRYYKDVSFATSESPDLINRAIFMIKSGGNQHSHAKDIILREITKIREKFRHKMPFALCCTELPVVFTEEELSKYRLICPSSIAVKDLERNHSIQSQSSNVSATENLDINLYDPGPENIETRFY